MKKNCIRNLSAVTKVRREGPFVVFRVICENSKGNFSQMTSIAVGSHSYDLNG